MAEAQAADWQPIDAPVAANDDWAPTNQHKDTSFVSGLEGTTVANPQVAAQWTANELRSNDPGYIKYPLVAAGTLQTFASGMVKQIADAFTTARGAWRGEPQSLENEISAGLLAAGLNAAPEGIGRLAKTAAPIVKEFQDTVVDPGIAKTTGDAIATPTPTTEGQPPPHPLQSLYDHLTQVQEAKQLGVIGDDIRPEPTVNDSPAKLAQDAVPQPLGAAVTPGEMRGNLGHEPGAYDARGKEWIDKIDAPDDVRQAIENIASDNDYFPVARGGEASPASRAAVAEAAGIDPADLDSEHFSTHFDSDGKVRAVIQALRQTTKDFMEASETARKDPSVENTAAALEAQMRHTNVLEYTMGLRAESGRTLAAWKDLLRQTERSKASVKIKADEQTGAAPIGASDLVDAAGEVQSNIKAGKDNIGIQKLIDAAEKLAAPEKEPVAGEVRKPISPELKGLIDEAKKALDAFKGDKTPTQLQKLIDAAEKNASIIGKQKTVKNPVEALPPELQSLVEKAENIVDRFGGIAKGEKAAMLLARTGKTAAEQEQLARSVSGLTPNQVANVLNKLRTSPEAGKPGWFYWLWQQGLISGLFTHAKYQVVNTATVMMERVISPFVAALIGKARGENVSLMAPLYANMAMIHSLPDAFSAAAQAFKTGMRVPLESEMRLYTRGEESPQTKGAASAYVQTISPDWGIWKKVFNEDQLDAAARVLGIPGRSANLIHTFYKVLSERASASSRAYETAVEEGATGDKFWDRYQYHLDNPTDDALRGAVNDAYTGAFMGKLGEKTGEWAKALANNPIAKWVFPFQHIPWNIERMSIEYSPLAILGPEMRGAILGKKGAPAQNLAIAKMAVGSSVIGYFVHKALSGQATGDYPIDPKERKNWSLNGTQANSVQMGDQWVSLERLGPVGNLAHIGANIGSIIAHYNGQDDDALTSAIWAASMAAVNQVGNEVGFQTLHNFIEAMENPKKAQRFVAWQAGSLMYPSSFISQNASFIDPYMRKADDIVSGLKYRVPLLRETLPVKRDPLYGEPVHNPGYHSVFRETPIAPDIPKLEMERLDYHPTAPINKVGGIKLSPELYDEYQATAGPLVKQLLQNYTQSPEYQSLPDSVKAREFKNLVEIGRSQARLAMQAHHQEIWQQGLEARKTAIFGKQ